LPLPQSINFPYTREPLPLPQPINFSYTHAANTQLLPLPQSINFSYISALPTHTAFAPPTIHQLLVHQCSTHTAFIPPTIYLLDAHQCSNHTCFTLPQLVYFLYASAPPIQPSFIPPTINLLVSHQCLNLKTQFLWKQAQNAVSMTERELVFAKTGSINSGPVLHPDSLPSSLPKLIYFSHISAPSTQPSFIPPTIDLLGAHQCSTYTAFIHSSHN
jgi:hypothetical protein